MTEPITMMLKKISDQIKMMGSYAFRNIELTRAQCHVLGIIDDNNGSCLQKQIEETLEVSHPTVVGLVSRLEASGYVSVEVDETDRRNRIVKNTEKANQTKEQFRAILQTHEQQIRDALNEEEQQQLETLLQKIYNRLDELNKNNLKGE